MRFQKVLVCAIFVLLVCFVFNENKVSSKNQVLAETSDAKVDVGILEDLTIEITSFVGSSSDAQNPTQQENFPTKAAEKRYAMLAGLIKKNPAEVLRVALADEILSKIPVGLGRFFEKHEEIEGELEVIAECDETDGRTLYYLNNGKERLSLQFAKQPDEELLTGTLVRLNGIRVGDAVAVNHQENSSTNFQTLNAPLPNTFGEQKLLVLLINFQDDLRQPFTVAAAQNMVFGTVNNFYRENSYQQTWLTGNTLGYYTLPINSGDCGGGNISIYAKQAAQNAGINLSAYQKFIYIFPTMPACSYGGAALIGGDEVWINGYLNAGTISHELGHTFGLRHARTLDCGATPVGTTCVSNEYGHPIDAMGAPGVTGHFHAFQKERLGWLNSGSEPPITTVQTSGNYTLAPYSEYSFAPKALKILKSNEGGVNTWYHIEFRRPIGFDSIVAGNANMMNGVLVTMNTETNGQQNYLLDMTPETDTFNDAALTVNRSYTDSVAGFTITPVSVGTSGATVNVTFGTVQCSPANPTISVAPTATQWIGAGSSVLLSLTVTNNNSSVCTNNNFNLQSAVPSNWNAVFASPVLNISPGASATTTVQISTPSSASAGFYSLNFSASNSSTPSYSDSTSTNCAVYSSLGVSVSPGQTNYTTTQTAVVTANVTANSTPIAGAIVTFSMRKSDGSIVTSSATSAANGSATFQFKFNKKRDPVGVYTVTVSANLNGISGNGSTSFNLK